MVPPRALTIAATIERPSPELRTFDVGESSPRKNRSKTWSATAGAMPGPASVTVLVTLVLSWVSIATSTWAAGRLTLGEHRKITVHRPDGIRYFTGTTTNRQPAQAATTRSTG